MLDFLKKNAAMALLKSEISDPQLQQSLVYAAQALLEMDNIDIISHRSPDGDTLGCSSALCRALRSMGKKANVKCADKIPPKYSFMFEGLDDQDFATEHVVTVDIASPQLMGALEGEYADRVELCIDHHCMNTITADVKVVNENAAAAGEVVWQLLKTLGAVIDEKTASSLYAAISTDTGCFKYSSVTASTHLIAVELMKCGIDHAGINHRLLDEVTAEGIALKGMAMSTLSLHFNNKCAVIAITSDMMEKSGASPDDTEGIASIPRCIKGVECGIFIKQQTSGPWRISVRTSPQVNAAEICAKFGGGGHKAAAGCRIEGDLETVKLQILNAAAEFLGAE